MVSQHIQRASGITKRFCILPMKLDSAGLFLFAAGNNGQLTDSTDITQQFFPADYGLANQISVGASDTNDALASFSNYGA